VVSSGKQLLRVVDDILDISKLEVGRMQIFKERISMSDVFGQVNSTMSGVAREQNVRLVFEQDPEEIFFEADQVKLSQVFINLVGNAIKFSSAGSRVIVKATERGATVRVAVVDCGMGIKEKDQQLVFEAFRQVDAGNTRKHGGTGLGLAITKKLVELHGGRLWLESDFGKGSTFFVELPMA